MIAAPPIRCALWIAAALAANADIIDRIAVSVGSQVITSSDIDREIRVNALLQGSTPQFDAKSRRDTAGRMVEQRLIRRELENSHYPIPQKSDIDPLVADLVQKQFRGDAAYRKALESYGITDQDVRDELLWQRTLLLFVNDRFRPAVQLTEQEIKDYFEKTVAPAARAAHPGQEVTIDEYREQIVEKLTGDRTDQEINNWLNEARKRTEIVYHPEAFQ